jgi:hypothetical protein
LLEEKLFMNTTHIVSLSGYELFRLTSVLSELLSAPPPVRRSPFGQVKVLGDWDPAGFGSAAPTSCV